MKTKEHPDIVGVVWPVGCTCRICLTLDQVEKAERMSKDKAASIFHTYEMEEHYASMVCDDCGNTFGEAAEQIKSR